MKKNIIKTSVTPVIMRQLPILKDFDKVRFLKCSTHIDMLHLMVHQIDNEFIKTKCEAVKDFEPFAFEIGVRYRHASGVEFSILSQPSTDNWIYEYQIQINPRDFVNFYKLEALVYKITGYKLNETNHKIQRIDIAFTLPINLFTPAVLHYCCQLKWKRTAKTYISNEFDSGSMTGTRTTSKSMNFSSYRRGYKVKDKHSSPGYVRFEFQIKKSSLRSLKLQYFHDIKTVDIDLIFKRINFYNVCYTYAVKKSQRIRFVRFQQDVVGLGFQQAKLKNNKHRSFHRDIKKFLVPLAINRGKAKVANCLKKRFKTWYFVWIKKQRCNK